MEKVDLIRQYVELKNQLGRQPSSTEFYKSTTNGKRQLGNAYGSNGWNKLVEECGDAPKEFIKDKSDFEEILIKYGNLFREIKRHPPETEWNYKKLYPSVNGITRSHGIKWAEMPLIFLEFAYGKPEWRDVVGLIPNKSQTNKITQETNIELSIQVRNYIPPIIQNLVDLSYDESLSLEFERKVNTAFEMLGFEVKHFGQGTGRKPDGIALCKSNPRYAILIDSKSRSDGYKFGTDDRAFIEYIKSYLGRLQSDGFDKIYFLVVSSKFSSIPEASIKRLELETHVPLTFITSSLLLKIVANKIERPRSFDLDKLRGLLIDSGEVTEGKVDKFLKELNKSQTI